MIAYTTQVHRRAQDSGTKRIDHFPEKQNDHRFSCICAANQRESTSVVTATRLVKREENDWSVVRPCVLWTSAPSSLLSLLRIATFTTTEGNAKKNESDCLTVEREGSSVPTIRRDREKEDNT